MTNIDLLDLGEVKKLMKMINMDILDPLEIKELMQLTELIKDATKMRKILLKNPHLQEEMEENHCVFGFGIDTPLIILERIIYRSKLKMKEFRE